MMVTLIEYLVWGIFGLLSVMMIWICIKDTEAHKGENKQ